MDEEDGICALDSVAALNQMVGLSAFDWFSQDDIGITVAKNKDATVTLHTLPWKHAWEVCADEALQLFKFKCIGCDLVAAVKPGTRWIQWFFLSEEWIWWGPSGSESLSCSLDLAHDGWDGLFKVFADEW